MWSKNLYMTDIIIVGGGLAGLINATILARHGFSVIVFEKKSYPFHKVCGEYISNEAKPFLARMGLYPARFHPTHLKKFQLTSTNGKSAAITLGMGGFGISRHTFDQFLYEKAKDAGATFHLDTSVTMIEKSDNHFEVKTRDKTFQAKLVICSHGKRAKLDANLSREFIKEKSPYVAVKYHIKTDFPCDTIALHNFLDGYCGISKIENETFNLCYLSHRDNLRDHKKIDQMEQEVLFNNPFIRNIFENSDFLFDEPLVINEVSFSKKEPVENGIFMSGDSAGTITPLCGNGMAIAIHSAKILSEYIISHWKSTGPDLEMISMLYANEWSKLFSTRLWAGRKIQMLFGSEMASNIGVSLAKVKPIAKRLIALTHGSEF